MNSNDKITDAPTTDHDQVVLEVPEVARRLRISRSFAYELIATGQLPGMRLGRRVLVPANMLDEFISSGGRRPAVADRTSTSALQTPKKPSHHRDPYD